MPALDQYKGRVYSFHSAESLLQGKASKRIGNNTELDRLTHDSIGVLLHRTYVVVFYRDGKVKLNSGGWQTVTTKDRMNRFSPFQVYQDDHEWYVVTNKGTVDFEDGMVIQRG